MAVVSVTSLKGIALDWALAKAEKFPITLDPMGFKKDAPNSPQAGFWLWESKCQHGEYLLIGDNYSPSKNWNQGGEIIEREKIHPIPPHGALTTWTATLRDGELQQTGDTMLEASMKVYVMSVFGGELDIPNQLV